MTGVITYTTEFTEGSRYTANTPYGPIHPDERRPVPIWIGGWYFAIDKVTAEGGNNYQCTPTMETSDSYQINSTITWPPHCFVSAVN